MSGHVKNEHYICGGEELDSKHTISSVLKGIYQRPGMYFRHDGHFEHYTTYIEGLLCGLSLVHHTPYIWNLSRAFAETYNDGQGANISLAYLVGDVLYENHSDDVKIEKYMTFVIDYFEKNDCAL